jgi:hypothetical protein
LHSSKAFTLLGSGTKNFCENIYKIGVRKFDDLQMDFNRYFFHTDLADHHSDFFYDADKAIREIIGKNLVIF